MTHLPLPMHCIALKRKRWKKCQQKREMHQLRNKFSTRIEFQFKWFPIRFFFVSSIVIVDIDSHSHSKMLCVQQSAALCTFSNCREKSAFESIQQRKKNHQQLPDTKRFSSKFYRNQAVVCVLKCLTKERKCINSIVRTDKVNKSEI